MLYILTYSIVTKEVFMTGEEIRYYRRLKGMTQKELAEQIPISIVQLSRYENGKVKNPSDVVINRIKEILDMEVNN